MSSSSLQIMSSTAPQILFTENNHWKFGWGKKNLYNFDEQDLPLWVKFGPCTSPPKSFDIEMSVTAKKIANAATKPIYLAMSGGMDSELIARVLLQEKIPFTPLIVQYDNDYNMESISYAFMFCKQHGLTPEIIKLDIVDFFEKSIETPYILSNCAHILQMHIMRHAASLGGMAIIGAGEQRYDKSNGIVSIAVPLERIAVTHFMQAEQVQGVSAFYCYTPELMYSILLEAKALGFDDLSKYEHSIKDAIYHKFWPDLTTWPKFSGLEKVDNERKYAQRELLKKYRSKLVKYSIPLFDFEQQLSGASNIFAIKY